MCMLRAIIIGDYHTKELTCEVGMSIVSSNSSLKVPHMIICHLDRYVYINLHQKY